MNRLKNTLLILLLILPFSSFAHGEEILYMVFSQFLSFLIFIILIVALKIKLKSKILLSGIYLFTVYATWIAINKMPYRENMIKINLIVIIPTIAFIISFFIIKSRLNRHNKID
jgi:hypothetical protein